MSYCKRHDRLMLVGKFVCIALAWVISTAPSAARKTQLQSFHIQGTIRRAYDGSTVQGVKVTFKGKTISKAVFSDQRGVYGVALPVGAYTMAAEPIGNPLQNYERPLFRVPSAASVTLDVSLDSLHGCDDCPGGGPGADWFPVPSEDGLPFQLLIRFERREANDHGYVYNVGWMPPDVPQVFVAYNLFTLQADHVVYDLQSRTLRATGNVLVMNSSGARQRADSLTFEIENGQASPIP